MPKWKVTMRAEVISLIVEAESEEEAKNEASDRLYQDYEFDDLWRFDNFKVEEADIDASEGEAV